MNTQHNASPHPRHRGGFALVVSLGVILIVSIASAGIFGLVRQEMHMATLTRDFLKARVIAEAGANAYYAEIRNNFTGFGEQPVTAFGDGEYQVTLTEIRPEWAQLRSVGRAGRSEAVVSMTLRNFLLELTEGGRRVSPGVFSNAMTAGGEMRLGGNVTVQGDIASADSITVQGNAATITGAGNSPSIDDKHNRIQGGEGNDPDRYTVDWDSFLRLEDYLAHAVTWNGRDLSSYPDNTILFVPGNISIAGGGTLRLSIIATGDISITGQAQLQQPGNYPTLVSRDGSIKMAGGSSAEGLIAVMSTSGTISTTGGGNTPVNIEGSIIVGGEFKDSGRWTISHGEVVLTPPDDEAVGGDHVVVIAWN